MTNTSFNSNENFWNMKNMMNATEASMDMDIVAVPAPVFESAAKGTTLTPFPENYQYAFAYVPYQQEFKTYSPEDGLENGTMFPALNQPYKKSNDNNIKPFMMDRDKFADRDSDRDMDMSMLGDKDRDMDRLMLEDKDIWRCSYNG